MHDSPDVSNAKETLDDGLYLYCVAANGLETSLEHPGIDDNEVFTISYNDISVVVHRCKATVYSSQNPETTRAWLLRHQEVVDMAWQRFGTVLPFGFDTIVKGHNAQAKSPEHNLKEWLENQYDNLRQQLDKVRNKAEYGVQISWDPNVIAEEIAVSVAEIRKLREEIKLKVAGTAYMYQQKIKALLKKRMEAWADDCFRDFYADIKRVADDIQIEKTKKLEDDKQMLMNLSCLICKDRVTALGRVLDRMEGRKGLFVRFTGPWPPYSFVTPGLS